MAALAALGAAELAGVVSAACLGGTLINTIAQQSVASASRSIVIHISNNSTDILINPQVHTSYGYNFLPPEPTVKKGVTTSTSFGNVPTGGGGAVGVMTYDITENRKEEAVDRLAIMFSVPYNYNHYVNWFALGFIDTDEACDESLFKLMYNKDGEFRREKGNGSEILFHGENYTLVGTMSPVKKAEMKVELWDSLR